MSPKIPPARAGAPLPMPQEGGAWIRQPDGGLIRDPNEAQTLPAPPPAAPQSKDAPDAD